MSIKTKVANIEARIEGLQHELECLQRECPHPKAKRVPRSNTGNYDPSQDCYWYDCHCPDCGLRWTEPQ